jgi:hypothetical protein
MLVHTLDDERHPRGLVLMNGHLQILVRNRYTGYLTKARPSHNELVQRPPSRGEKRFLGHLLWLTTGLGCPEPQRNASSQ